MVTRKDIRIDWHLSPRIINIDKPSTEISIQDLHDTIRYLEQFPNALQYPYVLDTTGKQVLGPSVFVGLTSALQNARIAFESRTASQSSGTITTDSLTGDRLIDSSATFITDGVEPGSWVINFDDQSLCSVVTVLSETELSTYPLGDGYTNQFIIGDKYKIWPVVQTEVAGGNIVAVDGYGDPIDAILPTAGTQVVRTSSSSATLQELGAIQYSSFNGGVTVDLTGSSSGINFPVGTPQLPVDNFEDALAIAAARGFITLYIKGNATIDNGLNFSGKRFVGEGQTASLFTIDSAANVINCTFNNATITGTLDGGASINDCQVVDLDFVDGFIISSVLIGTIILSGNNPAHFLNCWSGVTSVPIIDMSGSGSSLALRNYNGGIEIRNKDGYDAVSIDLNSGQILIDSTVTAGTIVVRGIGDLTDNSTGAAVVISDDLLRGETLNQIDKRQTDTQYGIETLRGDHPAQGNVFYWDSVNGSDTNSGGRPYQAFLTWAKVHDSIVSGRGDIVYVINTTGSSVITERVTITKSDVYLRAHGASVTFTALDDTADVMVITGHRCSLQGVSVIAPVGTPRNAIRFSDSQAPKMTACQVVSSNGVGIRVERCPGIQILRSFVSACSDNAIEIEDCQIVAIQEVVIDNNGGWGIKLDATYFAGTVSGLLDKCIINANSSGGIQIGANVVGTTIMDTCAIEDSLSQSPRIEDLSTGLQDVYIERQKDIRTIAFKSMVTIDSVNGVAGTAYPLGIETRPVNNAIDALTIATTNGLSKLNIVGYLTLSSGDYTAFNIGGSGHTMTSIIVDSLADVTDVAFTNCTLSGTLRDNVSINNCFIGSIDNFNGQLDECMFDGYTAVVLSGDSYMNNCFQAIENGIPEIDMGGDGYTLSVRNYAGTVLLTNKTGPEPVIFGMMGGVLEIDSTVTNGTITVRGVGTIIDNSTGTADVVFTDLVSPDNVASAIKPTILPLYSGL